MSDWNNDAGTSSLLDALLRALETMPGIDDAAWDLDCLRVALRIARATEDPGDLKRADLALGALTPDSRTRLLNHVTMLARQRVQQPPVQTSGEGQQAGRMTSAITSLFGRSDVDSGTTARDRLMRDVAGGG